MNFFFAFLALLMVCSCAKNYPEMVKDRVVQLQNLEESNWDE